MSSAAKSPFEIDVVAPVAGLPELRVEVVAPRARFRTAGKVTSVSRYSQ